MSSLWLIRLFAFISLFSLSICYPLNDLLTPRSLETGNETESSTLPDSLFDIVKRAPPKLRPFSEDEQKLNRDIATRINSYLQTGDTVWFLGNSGGYLAHPFDLKKFNVDGQVNMKSIPISSTKNYGQPDFKASSKGLARYFDKILKETLVDGNGGVKDIGRIVLVDHSSSGKSVDGFKEAFKDMVRAGYQDKGHCEDIANEAATWFSDKLRLINVIDYIRGPKGNKKVTDPANVPVIDRIDAGKANQVNILLGDKRKHDRITPDYPPAKWEQPARDSWGNDGSDESRPKISPEDERQNGKLMEESISQWNRKNGGLIAPTYAINPDQGPSTSQNDQGGSGPGGDSGGGKGKGKGKQSNPKGKNPPAWLEYITDVKPFNKDKNKCKRHAASLNIK